MFTLTYGLEPCIKGPIAPLVPNRDYDYALEDAGIGFKVRKTNGKRLPEYEVAIDLDAEPDPNSPVQKWLKAKEARVPSLSEFIKKGLVEEVGTDFASNQTIYSDGESLYFDRSLE